MKVRRKRPSPGRCLLWLSILLVGAPVRAGEAPESIALARELGIFRAWLDRTHPGYGCDEGPAPFRNDIVESAYRGRRFYYVLTYARGIAPPFRNSVSTVVHVDDDGTVEPLNVSAVETFRAGLGRVTRAAEARRAAAAVLRLSLGDPGQRRYRIDPDRFKVKKGREGWACTYPHDPNRVSRVAFDGRGLLSAIQPGPPPVP